MLAAWKSRWTQDARPSSGGTRGSRWLRSADGWRPRAQGRGAAPESSVRAGKGAEAPRCGLPCQCSSAWSPASTWGLSGRVPRTARRGRDARSRFQVDVAAAPRSLPRRRSRPQAAENDHQHVAGERSTQRILHVGCPAASGATPAAHRKASCPKLSRLAETMGLAPMEPRHPLWHRCIAPLCLQPSGPRCVVGGPSSRKGAGAQPLTRWRAGLLTGWARGWRLLAACVGAAAAGPLDRLGPALPARRAHAANLAASAIPAHEDARGLIPVAPLPDADHVAEIAHGVCVACVMNAANLRHPRVARSSTMRRPGAPR